MKQKRCSWVDSQLPKGRILARGALSISQGLRVPRIILLPSSHSDIFLTFEHSSK